MAMSTISSSLNPGGSLTLVNVPTRDQATVAVAQVRDALGSIYLSSQSMKARATSSNPVDNRAMVAFRLLTESPEAQEVVAEVVSDCNVFGAIWEKLHETSVFRNLIETVQRITEEATSCLLPRADGDFAEEDEMISFTNRASRWVRMFQMVVEAVTGMWKGLVDMFPSAIPRIQAAFARKGDAGTLETAIVITGLVVLVTAVILVL